MHLISDHELENYLATGEGNLTRLNLVILWLGLVLNLSLGLGLNLGLGLRIKLGSGLGQSKSLESGLKLNL